MDFTYYLERFQKAADTLDKELLHQKQIEVAVGVVLDSVFLKLYKKAWANKEEDPLVADSRIFFSTWINDGAIAKGKILYNIHAFKLRKLDGYAITSRTFAERFRKQFKPFEKNWSNVSTQYGPLTLMEGWQKTGTGNLEDLVAQLANNFLDIEYLIDDTLNTFKLPAGKIKISKTSKKNNSN